MSQRSASLVLERPSAGGAAALEEPQAPLPSQAPEMAPAVAGEASVGCSADSQCPGGSCQYGHCSVL
jgi:hypothetical protein